MGRALIVAMHVTFCVVLSWYAWLQSAFFRNEEYADAAYVLYNSFLILTVFGLVLATTVIFDLAELPPDMETLANKEKLRKRADNYDMIYRVCFVLGFLTVLATLFIHVAYARTEHEVNYTPGFHNGTDVFRICAYTSIVIFVYAVVFYFSRRLRFELMRNYGPKLKTWILNELLPWTAVAFLAQTYLIFRYFFHMEVLGKRHNLSWYAGRDSSLSFGTILLCAHVVYNWALLTFLNATGLELVLKSGNDSNDLPLSVNNNEVAVYGAAETEQNAAKKESELNAMAKVAADIKRQDRKHAIVFVSYCLSTFLAVASACFIEAEAELIEAGTQLTILGTIYAFAACLSLLAAGLMQGRKSKGHFNQYLWQSGSEFHFFISHAQANGQDQVHAMTRDLENLGVKVWRDMDQAQITWAGMKKGVENSLVFMLFLTKGAIARPWVQMEVLHAISLKKPIILVNETDERHGGDTNFYALFDSEKHLSHLKDQPHLQAQILKVSNFLNCLKNVESISYKRRNWEAESMYDKILKELENVGKGQLVGEELERRSAEAEELLLEIIEREGLGGS
ncbi:TIR domain-containing protein [Pseudoscourfieldia marina]